MSSNVANLLVALFQQYGFDVAQLGTIIYCFWKIGTNHLVHIQEAIDIANKQIASVKHETHEIKKDMTHLKERVSYVEGQLKK